jgi:nitrous oxide reductase
METDNTKNQVSRRGFLGVNSAALAATVGALSIGGSSGQEQTAGSRGASDRSRSDPGPGNSASDAQNPDSTR